MTKRKPKLILLEGGYNCRDIGGYPTHDGGQTRYGLIYRSGGLHKLSPTDQATLSALNIRSVFDLRESYEQRDEGADQVGEDMTVYIRSTSLGSEQIRKQLETDPHAFRMVDYYISSLAPRAEYHAELFREILAQLENPLIIHCSAGKDRTGIIIALLLRVAGVDDETIIADYIATDEYLQDYVALHKARFDAWGAPDSVVEELFTAPARNMQAFLTELDQTFGSAEAYLMAGGLTAEELATFRALFVEKTASN